MKVVWKISKKQKWKKERWYKSCVSVFECHKRKSIETLQFENNTKETWGVIKERNTDIKSVILIKFVFEKQELKDIAEEFNNFLTNVEQNLAKKF